ncbi:glycosyltransferase family 2 protein [Paraglaciecola sp.]|uniref:glycosyltransferase family 2 protein n=1 Tax=Paraglaciecola sp. TaxID=1920173 RepID=UPI00273DB657|nr:glycosyltransferase family 2 protein [Paraglaciecola sp.]MDP5032816.1 glycosyltransferase family 2 protein [Paraglaciecola sp.]
MMFSYLRGKMGCVYRFLKRVFWYFKGELYWFYAKLLNVFTQNNDLKVKLVAIAKDEAAYLPDWIFHHIYFGFDHISIYVNNTTDNTQNLKERLSLNAQVSFLDGDKYFNHGNVAPQISIYKAELKLSKKQGFTHVMFLDIDEFWIPTDFETTIHEFLKGNEHKINCFEWLNRINESEAFMDACPPILIGHRARPIKSIIPTHLPVLKINPHSILAPRAVHSLADGTVLSPSEVDFSRVPAEELDKPVKPFFIMHRMFRSEDEYLAILARGRPIQNRCDVGIFKNNRNGYVPTKAETKIVFPSLNFKRYVEAKKTFYLGYSLENILNDAKAFIMLKRYKLVEMIRNAPPNEAETLSRVLKNVTRKDILDAYDDFKKRNNSF